MSHAIKPMKLLYKLWSHVQQSSLIFMPTPLWVWALCLCALEAFGRLHLSDSWEKYSILRSQHICSLWPGQLFQTQPIIRAIGGRGGRSTGL